MSSLFDKVHALFSVTAEEYFIIAGIMAKPENYLYIRAKLTLTKSTVLPGADHYQT